VQPLDHQAVALLTSAAATQGNGSSFLPVGGHEMGAQCGELEAAYA
jgi:hypothetical protein